MGDHTGGWVALLGDLRGCSVRAAGPLTARDRRLLSDAGARLVAGGPGDVVVLVEGRLDAAGAARLVAAARPGGRVAVLAANPASPVARLDAARGRAPSGVRAERPAALLAAAGAPVLQVHGLLRSAAEPVTAVDLACPAATRAVLAASRAHVRGARGAGLALLSGLAGRPGLARAVPALLVTAVRGAAEPAPDRVTGMIGNRDSEEVKLVRGEPPVELEKHYAEPGPAEAEAAALAELAAAGLGLAPRLLGRPAPRRVRMSWLPGRPAALPRNPRAALRVVEAVVGALRAVQGATARADGTVLVHGDFWPGNVLLGERAGVVDWTGAHRGSPRTDRDFLLGELARERPGLAAHAARLLDQPR